MDAQVAAGAAVDAALSTPPAPPVTAAPTPTKVIIRSVPSGKTTTIYTTNP